MNLLNCLIFPIARTTSLYTILSRFSTYACSYACGKLTFLVWAHLRCSSRTRPCFPDRWLPLGRGKMGSPPGSRRSPWSSAGSTSGRAAGWFHFYFSMHTHRPVVRNSKISTHTHTQFSLTLYCFCSQSQNFKIEPCYANFCQLVDDFSFTLHNTGSVLGGERSTFRVWLHWVDYTKNGLPKKANAAKWINEKRYQRRTEFSCYLFFSSNEIDFMFIDMVLRWN